MQLIQGPTIVQPDIRRADGTTFDATTIRFTNENGATIAEMWGHVGAGVIHPRTKEQVEADAAYIKRAVALLNQQEEAMKETFGEAK